MHDLLFTLPGDDYPFSADVRASWSDEAYEFRLNRRGLPVTVDRSYEQDAPNVLDAFLMQLVSDSPE
jgi:hypothetical protein